jgi:FdhD protein
VPSAYTTIHHDRGEDEVAVEEPLEIRVGEEPLAVTMRTPGHDEELALGFLFSEGLIDGPRQAGPTADLASNIVEVEAPLVRRPATRRFYTTSSCGVCGKASLDAVRTRTVFSPEKDPVEIPAEVLFGLPDALRAAQKVFDSTGGLHGAGLFTADGTLLAAREDVGRHNAVDKVLGHALLTGAVPAAGTVLMVSGRASFELTQKAVMAGVPALAAVSAPSSLAVEMADDAGMTLVGFLRGRSMNIYAGASRIVGIDDDAR